MINYAQINYYKHIIFTDLDDYFSKNRISDSIKMLEKNDIIFNEIDIVNEHKGVIEKNFISKKHNFINELDYNNFLDYNLLGLTNTAVNLKILKGFKKIEHSSI